MLQIIDFLIHFVTFIAVFLPLSVLLLIQSREFGRVIGLKSRNEVVRSLNFLVLGLLPIAVFHFLEVLSFFGIELLSHENTFLHVLIEHTALIIAFLSITWFLLKFKQKFIESKDKVM